LKELAGSERLGGKMHVVALDVSDEGSIVKAAGKVGEILSQVGDIPGAAGLDYLIQNAAVVSSQVGVCNRCFYN
jgi:hypothetical protein